MNAKDAEILGKVYACLLTYGAASTERMMRETELDAMSVLWATFQLNCKESGGLWTLPDKMLPSGWDGDTHKADCATC